MTVLSGYLLENGEWGIENWHLTIGQRGFAEDQWPRHTDITDAVALHRTAFSRASNVPVLAENAHAVAGHVIHSYFDDFYNRIHVLPQILDLGNVVSTQIVTIDVWNSYLVPVTLNGVSGGAVGVSIDGPTAFPMGFGAIQMTSWDVSVTIEGPPIVEALYTWDFNEVWSNDPTLSVVGRRVIAWTVSPDWKNGITETITFLTDVLGSRTGAEQRRALRVHPKRAFRARSLIERRERALIDNLLHGWGGQIWAIPMWHDVQTLSADLGAGAMSIPCTTTYRDFEAGRLAILRGTDAFRYETVEIESLTGSALTLVRPTLYAWGKGTRLYPARLARLAGQPRFKRMQDQAWDIDYRFVVTEPCTWTPFTFTTTYRSHPVYEVKPDETEDVTGTFERLLAVLDNDVAAPYVVDTADEGFALQSHRWIMHGAAEHDTVRRLIYALRGRQKCVWVPTHADDLRVIATVGGSSVEMTIENVGFALQALGHNGRRDIRIKLANGTIVYKRITNAAEVDIDTETITIDSSFGSVLQPADFKLISFMRLMRLDDDEVEIKHVTDIAGVGEAEATFRAIRDDL